MTKKELWLKLQAYHFEQVVPQTLWDQVTATFGNINPSTKAFASKLAHKQKWKQRFALKAVAEYKRFVYLGVVSEFVVTPSEVIDVIWHQHLLFSKAYRLFCSDIIQYEFDHTPELINMTDQTGIFSAQYLDTVALYKKEFGVEPPEAIWGKPKFDENELPQKKYKSKKKASTVTIDGSTIGNSSYADEFCLCAYFDDNGGESFSDFEGGDGGGGGAGDSWSDGGDSSDGGDGGSGCSGGCGGD